MTGMPDEGRNVSTDRRARWLLYLFLLVGILAGGRLIYLATYARSELLGWGENIAWRRGVMIPLRGKIYDSAGVLLAESVRHFDLEVVRPQRLDDEDYRILIDQIRQLTPIFEDNGVLRAVNLAPDQLARLAPLRREYPEIRAFSRQERIYYGSDKLRKIVGEVRTGGDDIPRGASGLEARYDDQLTGQIGRFRLAKDGRAGSFELETAPEPGKDVVLTVTVAELLNKVEMPK